MSDPLHFKALLMAARASALSNLPNERNPSGDIGLPGIRVLGQRHHSETLKLEVK